MIKDQLVRSFMHAALSPDPDLAIAALMIARIAPISREMICNYIAERVLGLPKSY